MVSLSSYCQYPTVKVIGKDSVVVMTIKQGQEINSQFSTLKDSLNSNTKTIIDLRAKIKFSEKNLSDTVRAYENKLLDLNKENQFLSEEKKRIEKRIWSDRRERRFTTVGFASVILGWLTFWALAD